MAKNKDIKKPQEAAKLFEGVVKASVKGNPKPKRHGNGEYVIKIADDVYLLSEVAREYYNTVKDIDSAKHYHDKAAAITALEFIIQHYEGDFSKAIVLRVKP